MTTATTKQQQLAVTKITAAATGGDERFKAATKISVRPKQLMQHHKYQQ